MKKNTFQTKIEVPARGRIQEFGISEILLGLQGSSRTGTLSVESRDARKTIFFRRGKIAFALSNLNEDEIPALLLRESKITEDQCRRASAVAKTTGRLAGAILVESGYIEPKELVRGVRSQAEHIVKSLFFLEEGSFSFRENGLPEDIVFLEISCQTLIYEATKLHPAVIHPSNDAIILAVSDPAAILKNFKLDAAARRILSKTDSGMSVSEVLSASGMEVPEGYLTLHALSAAGFLEISDSCSGSDECGAGGEGCAETEREAGRKPQMDENVRRMIDQMHDTYEGLGYYGVLCVRESAQSGEIKAAYYNAAKKFHPDMHFDIADPITLGKLSDIFAYIYKAYKTLTDPAARTEYDYWLAFRPENISENSGKAKDFFAEGELRLKERNYEEAERLFGEAAHYDSKTSRYHFFHGLARAGRRKLKEAARAFERARRLEPENAEYLAELGFSYLEMGFPARAKGLFEKVLKISPDHARAREGIASLPK